MEIFKQLGALVLLDSIVLPLILIAFLLNNDYDNVVIYLLFFVFQDHLADTCRHNVSKSQMMDDVLEILIRNGELPASAAHDQTSAGSGVDNSVVNAASDFDIHMDDPFAMDVVCNDDLMMDVDTDWLDSLDLPPPSAEPLADLFNGEATDNDFKLPANMDFLWDRIDFAT